jgi:hypothetical protein
MSMALHSIIALVLVLLLSSCAQVGTISGGQKDEEAPYPISGKTNPENKSIYFTGSEIEMEFSEFIKLNNPNETVVLVPPHARVEAVAKGHKLLLTWNDMLQPNTTYVLNLNGTVQDITEGNDSLIQYVFSTGDFIDSLMYQASVVDAFTNKPLKNCIVGLFETDSLTSRPTYFAQSDANGKANLNYLRPGTYTLIAFEDKNKDLIPQVNERQAFKNESVTINESHTDSIPLRVFTPSQAPGLRTFSYKAPGAFIVGATVPIDQHTFTLNKKMLAAENLYFMNSDSVVIFPPNLDTNNYELIVTGSNFTDTTSTRITQKERSTKLVAFSNSTTNSLSYKDTLTYHFMDLLTAVDTSKIRVMNAADSSLIQTQISFQYNALKIHFPSSDYKKVQVILLPACVTSNYGLLSDTVKSFFSILSAVDFGTIQIDASAYKEPIVVELLKSGKVVHRIDLSDEKMHLLTDLTPGEYQTRIILDKNGNGRWDTGNVKQKLQPEEIHYFTDVTKVRANWDVELKLAPNN